MTNFDTELRDRLATLADRAPMKDVVDASILNGRRRRTRRLTGAASASLAIVVAAIAIPLTIPSTPAPARHIVHALPAPALRPARSSFQVTAPIGAHSSPARFTRPPKCRPKTVSGAAELRPVDGGVAGVVSVKARNCRLVVANPAITIPIPGSGHAVTLGRSPDTANDFGDVTATSEALEAGRAAIGFYWLGSWCGPRPSTIAVNLIDGQAVVPIRGPTPPCLRRGTSAATSALYIGNIEAEGPALAAPPVWRFLSAHLAITRLNTATTLRGVRITFANPTPHDISLTPIPNYVIGVEDRNGDGTPAEVIAPLPYPPVDLIVPAHGTLSLALPDVDISRDVPNFVSSKIRVTFSIEGVPSATTTTQVRF